MKALKYRFIIIFSFFVVLFSLSYVGLSHADDDDYIRESPYTIYTWNDNDQITADMISAVRHFLYKSKENQHSNEPPAFPMLFKLAALFGMLIVLFSLFSEKPASGFVIISKIVGIVLIFSLLQVKTTVSIIDMDNGKLDYTANKGIEVQQAPLFVVFPLAMISNIENSLRKNFRQSLAASNTQNSPTAGKIGDISIIRALSTIHELSNYRIADPAFIRTFDAFTKNCILPDIYTGYVDVGELMNNENFWGYLKKNAIHPARLTQNYMISYRYDVGGPAKPADNHTLTKRKEVKVEGGQISSNLTTCRTAYDELSSIVMGLVGTGLGTPGGGSGMHANLFKSLGYISQDAMNKELGEINNVLFRGQVDSSSILKASIGVNAFNDAYSGIASSLGVSSDSLAYGTAKANETMKMSSIMSSINAKKYLPLAKGYLTVIFIAIIPLVVLLGLATGNFRKPAGMILGILMALSLWGIGEQILDFIILSKSREVFDNMAVTGGFSKGVFTGYIVRMVDQSAMDMLSLSLGMYWMIPTLAFAVATMSGYAASSMMSGISGIASAGLSSAAAEAASGNASFGNVRAMTYNTNKFDAASTWSYGNKTSTTYGNEVNAFDKNSVSSTHEKTMTDKEIYEQLYQNTDQKKLTFDNIGMTLGDKEYIFSGEVNTKDGYAVGTGVGREVIRDENGKAIGLGETEAIDFKAKGFKVTDRGDHVNFSGSHGTKQVEFDTASYNIERVGTTNTVNNGYHEKQIQEPGTGETVLKNAENGENIDTRGVNNSYKVLQSALSGDDKFNNVVHTLLKDRFEAKQNLEKATASGDEDAIKKAQQEFDAANARQESFSKDFAKEMSEYKEEKNTTTTTLGLSALGTGTADATMTAENAYRKYIKEEFEKANKKYDGEGDDTSDFASELKGLGKLATTPLNNVSREGSNLVNNIIEVVKNDPDVQYFIDRAQESVSDVKKLIDMVK